jgi:hypothetical protein
MNLPLPPEPTDPNIDAPTLPDVPSTVPQDNPDGVPVQPTVPPTPIGDPPIDPAPIQA